MIEAISYAIIGATAVIGALIIYQLLSTSVFGIVVKVKRELDLLRVENRRCYTTINQLRDAVEDAAVASERGKTKDLLIDAYEDELCKVRASNTDLRNRNETLQSNFSAALNELSFQNDLVAKYCDGETEMKIKMAQAGYLDGGKSSNVSSKANNDD